MIKNMKSFIAVVFLAVLSVVFGIVGTAAPLPEQVSPQQPSASPSATQFVNPPTYDSDWVPIGDKAGQDIALAHGLNTTEVVVDITGKTSIDSAAHQKNLGLDAYPGWSKIYGVGTYPGNWFHSVIQKSDGGYVLGGTAINAGSRDFWMISTDWSGNVDWNKTFGGLGDDDAWSMVQTSDGGYAIAGTRYYDFWLVKIDRWGTEVWNKTYDLPSRPVKCWSLTETTDFGFALVGTDELYFDVWLVKTDAIGNAVWNQTYSVFDEQYGLSVIQTNDGGYAITGRKDDFATSTMFDVFLIKVDSVGTLQWNRAYDDGMSDIGSSVIQTNDGGYAIAGATDTDFWLIKTDPAGYAMWNRTYGGGAAYSVIQTSDGGYAFVGHGDANLVKTDANGEMSWNKTYGAYRAYSIVETAAGGYALAGVRGYFDAYFVITDLEYGLAMTSLTPEFTTLHRGTTDQDWNYVRVRMWIVKEPSWQYGDINQDGKVDAQDLFILGRNYGKTFSLLSLSGIVAIAGIHTVKKRKQVTLALNIDSC